MKFEVLSDLLIERYTNEEIIEEAIPAIPFLAIIAAGSAWTVALDWYIKNHNNGELPWWLTPKGTGMNDYLWMGISVFDITGQMSQVYFQEALKEREKDPDDPWNNILVWLTFMGTLPLTNLSPIGVIKFVSGYTTVRAAFVWLFKGIGKKLQQTGAIDKGIPAAIAKLSHEGKGKEAILLRQSTESALGVRITDESIEAAAKKHKLEIKTPGLVKTPIKGAAAAAKIKKGVETTGKIAKPITKIGGIAGKLAGAGAMFSGLAGDKLSGGGAKFGGTPVNFGWEGGRVGP
jgi:hypothetical protein